MRTRTPVAATSIILCNRMRFDLQRNTHFIKVSNLFANFSLKHHSSSTLFTEQPQFNPHKSIKPQINPSSINVSGATKSILTTCSDYFLGKKTQPLTANASSIQKLLLNVSHINPRITRKFWRKNELEPQDLLELLLGFESYNEKLRLDAKKVGSLLEIFKWISSNSKKDRNFKHFDKFFKIMVGLLVRVGLYKDAEWVLLSMDKEGILLDDYEIYSNLIEWYVSVDELEKSINLYDRMRGLNLIPSLSCYCTLVNYLVNNTCENDLLSRVYGDMIDTGLAENCIYENVIQVLCRAGKVLESRNLIKKAYVNGIKPTFLILDAIASRYCEKKDYYDLLNLFAEIDCHPDIVIGNKIIHSMCQNLGAEKAFDFLENLEHLGFTPDATTFGILIGWCCKEGNLKNAFLCLSNVLSRGLKPHKYSYNSIISGVFKEGMWNHVKDIVLEMEDEGVTLDMSTYKILLAGYCKSRQFEEVKMIIKKMVNNGLIKLLSLQDPITKAFLILGIDPLNVRVRRDNDMKFSKTEFYDSVGNGLYLEGKVVEFDQLMINVLNDSTIPDFNRIITKDDGFNIFKTVDELFHWGQEVSFNAFGTLLKTFRASNSGFKTITSLLEKMPNLQNELNEEMLNLLVQMRIKRGFIHKAKKIYDKLVKENMKIENKTYSALVTGLCKKGSSKDLCEFRDLVQNKNWSPTLNDYKTLIFSLCQNNMVTESLFLFERVMLDYSQESVELVYSFLETLCEFGFTKVARVLFEKLLETGYNLDYGLAYSHLLHGFCKENRFSEAFVMSNTMLTKRFSLNDDSYNGLLHGYCVAKDVYKIKEVFGAILKKNITIYISSYSKLVSLMCNQGRFHSAFLVKDLTVKQSSSHIALYNILIFHLFYSKNVSFVDTVLDEIQKKGLEFDDVTYNFLVYGFSRCKSVSRSVYYLMEMMSKQLKPSNRCLRAVIKSLEFNKILKLSQEMETRGWVHCSTVQNEIVTGFLKTGKILEAVNFLENISVKNLVPDNINYNNLIKQMCRYGRKDKALDLLDIMLRKENIPDSTSYDCLIQDSCVYNKIEEALDLYTEMMNMKLDPSIKTFEVLTEKLCEIGRTFEAEKMIDDMINVGEQPSKVVFGSVVSRYRFERNFTKASEVLQRMQGFGYKPDFETHWSLVSTLSRFSDRGKDDNSRSFLSTLLSQSGFKPKLK